MKNKAVLVGLLAAWVPGMAAADDLLSLYQEALFSDAQFTSARAAYAATEERLPQSMASRLPSLSLSGNVTANHLEANTFDQESYGSWGWSVNLTQPVFRLENEYGYDQTRSVVDQARAELELARQELVLRLADAYFAVLLAQDTVATLQSERASIHEQLAAANRGYELGTANITDVRDAQARYDLVGAQQIVARNDLAARLEQLRLIINRTPGAPPPLRPGVVLSGPQPDDMEAWVQAAATDNLAVLAGQAALEVARLETRKARAARYPQLDMVASYGSSKSATINTVGLDLDERRIGLQMSMPIYSGGGLVARERETRNLLDKANADLDNARRNGMLNARQAYLNATAGLAEVGALEQALVSAQTALQANQRGLELGVRANIDVLNAQQQVSTTERDLSRARYETLLALLRLKAAAGRLGEDDLRQLNALFAL
jgi:outer membrane protein